VTLGGQLLVLFITFYGVLIVGLIIALLAALAVVGVCRALGVDL